jgi:hydrogenase expression/formation protein HypE
VAFVAAHDAERALEIMLAHKYGEGACQIGTVSGNSKGLVTMQSRIDANRIVDLLSGEQLPRIC